MKVQDLMTHDVKRCHSQDTLAEAARIMLDHDCGVVPVVEDGDPARVVGMITDRDICMAAYSQGKNLEELHVEEAMARDLCTCAPENDVAEAEKRMSEGQVRRLAVVDRRGKLLGLLSLADLARGARQGQLTHSEIGGTLASVTEERHARAGQAPPGR